MIQPLRVVECFAGIGAFGLAAQQAGMEVVAQIEINKAARGVLTEHNPNVKQLGDIRDVEPRRDLPDFDVLCGGSPCQDISAAGPRKGLDGERSGLFFEFIRILKATTPRWFVFENVPNLLSINEGRDFATALVLFQECGFTSIGWRVINAKHWGVPQHRRRLFVVGYSGNGSGAAEILFEQESRAWYPQARKKEKKAATTRAYHPTEDTGPKIVGALLASGAGTARPAGNHNEANYLVTVPEVAETLTTRNGERLADTTLIAFNANLSGASSRASIVRNGDYTGTVMTNNHEAIAGPFGIRRLTPTECEKLMGLPVGWTATSNGKLQKDRRRYHQLGNSLVVGCARWIFKRIVAYENKIEATR